MKVTNSSRALLILNIVALLGAGALLWVFFRAACWAVYV